VTAPIVLNREAWVCAGAYVHLGVTLGEGAVAGARAVVMKDVPAWTVVAGNPARTIKQRIMTRK
jgi:putative colanic acid biosynthesis acetyltransferase WcaF